MERLEEILELSLDAGRLMLESNSEIYRAEEVIVNICRSFGIKNIDVFTLATCIYLSVNIEGKTYTRIRRIYKRETDLLRISKINRLSRNIVGGHYTVDSFREESHKIEEYDGFAWWKRAVTISASCAVFGIMFSTSSTISDFIITFIISLLTYRGMRWLNPYGLNAFISNMIFSIFMTLMAAFAVHLHIASDIDTIVIGAIMILVPGVVVTNAVRDTINGDILSGTIRTIEAIIVAAGIAFGVGMTLYFCNLGGLL